MDFCFVADSRRKSPAAPSQNTARLSQKAVCRQIRRENKNNKDLSVLHLVTSWIDYVGIVIFAIGALFLIASAFEKSTGWGVAMLLFGAILWPIFVLIHWSKASYWFFFALAGFLIVYIF
jgi:hypothetical protein